MKIHNFIPKRYIVILIVCFLLCSCADKNHEIIIFKAPIIITKTSIDNPECKSKTNAYLMFNLYAAGKEYYPDLENSKNMSFLSHSITVFGHIIFPKNKKKTWFESFFSNYTNSIKVTKYFKNVSEISSGKIEIKENESYFLFKINIDTDLNKNLERILNGLVPATTFFIHRNNYDLTSKATVIIRRFDGREIETFFESSGTIFYDKGDKNILLFNAINEINSDALTAFILNNKNFFCDY